MALFLAAGLFQPSPARKQPEFLASSRLRDWRHSRRVHAAGKYAGQPLKASCAGGLAPLLCALSPTSRVYLSQGLSIRVTLFEGRNLKLAVVSTQTAHFVDRCHNLVLASTEILVFMDKTAQLEPTLFPQTPAWRR